MKQRREQWSKTWSTD